VLVFLLGLILTAGKDFKVETRLNYQVVSEKDGPFINATDLALDREGNLYILDVDARKVFSWDAKGKFIRSFGRAGNGPGEFAFDPNYRYFYNLTVTRDRLAISNTRTSTLILRLMAGLSRTRRSLVEIAQSGGSKPTRTTTYLSCASIISAKIASPPRNFNSTRLTCSSSSAYTL
jgi:6-bladed beta-propeller